MVASGSATPTTTWPPATCRRASSRSPAATRAPASSPRSARTRPVGRSATTSSCRSCPGCGRCRWCASGMQNLCDLGANVLTGCRADGSFRMSIGGEPIGQGAGISTFCEHTRRRRGLGVKIDKDLPLEKVCLLGCGVGTGWGSAVNAAEVRPGHTVIVMGIGGIGINAVQGAAHAGATTSSPWTRSSSSARRRRSSAPPTASPHGRGRRVRPFGDQRPGRRLGHRDRRRAQDRARRPGVRRHPQGGHGRGDRHRQRERRGAGARRSS